MKHVEIKTCDGKLLILPIESTCFEIQPNSIFAFYGGCWWRLAIMESELRRLVWPEQIFETKKMKNKKSIEAE